MVTIRPEGERGIRRPLPLFNDKVAGYYTQGATQGNIVMTSSHGKGATFFWQGVKANDYGKQSWVINSSMVGGKMKTIYKYPLNLGTTAISMPRESRILHVGNQRGDMYLWAEIEPNAPTEDRDFYVIGTGHSVPDNMRYIGTAIIEPFVWHVYENRILGPILMTQFQHEGD